MSKFLAIPWGDQFTFYEMMMRSTLYDLTNTLSWVFILPHN